jgi:uncharacterized protein with FMN-binding domain
MIVPSVHGAHWPQAAEQRWQLRVVKRSFGCGHALAGADYVPASDKSKLAMPLCGVAPGAMIASLNETLRLHRCHRCSPNRPLIRINAQPVRRPIVRSSMIRAEHAARVNNDVPAATAAGWALTKGARRVLLVLHITLACVWLGALAATILLVGVQQVHPVAAWRAGLDRAVLLVHDTLIVNASYGFILTGLMFSLFTTWGAFRLWWVSLKWILLAGLGLALPLWVAPHVSSMSALSDAMSGEVGGQAAYAGHAQAVMLASALQAVVLVGIVAISVFKPWGPRPALRHWPRAVALGIAALIVLALAGNLWVQNVLIEGYRRLPVAEVDVGALRDGRYEGQDAQTGFVYRVRVSVAGGRIERVAILSTRDSHYARLAALATDMLAGRTRNDVDAVSGATTTSKALLRAVADALQHAPRREAAP